MQKITGLRGLSGIVVLCLAMAWCGFAWANPSYHRAEQLYQAFQYQRAISWLQRASRTASTPKERSRIAVMRALCHYNLGQLNAARRSYEQALSFERRGTLPGGESPAVVAHFRKLRQSWLARHPAPRKVVRKLPIQRGLCRAPSQ